MTRRIGENVRAICAAVGSGAANANAVAALSGLSVKEVRRRVSRAEDYRLLKIDRSSWPHTYDMGDAWSEVMDEVKAARPMPANSVFQWAQV